jgi:hypothetical protein
VFTTEGRRKLYAVIPLMTSVGFSGPFRALKLQISAVDFNGVGFRATVQHISS